MCTLVARPAATPHTRPVPISGSAADSALARRFGLGPSGYQGPTGIIGVLHDAMRKHGLPLVSLAASVPHYLSVDENPPATLALLRALEPMLGFAPPLDELERDSEAFLQRVEEASSGDDQIIQYVRALEEQYQEGDAPLVQPRFRPRTPGTSCATWKTCSAAMAPETAGSASGRFAELEAREPPHRQRPTPRPSRPRSG